MLYFSYLEHQVTSFSLSANIPLPLIKLLGLANTLGWIYMILLEILNTVTNKTKNFTDPT